MRGHARTGKLSVPMHVANGRGGAAAIRVRSSAAVLGVALALLSMVGPAAVRASHVLTDAAVSPGSGTTATLFDLSVTYTGTPPTLPARVWAVIPGGTEVDLATTDATAPATYRASTTLPAGDLTITFLAPVVGNHQPTAEARVTVTPEPGPTLGATPTPLASATPPPGSPAPSAPPSSAAPSGSAVPSLPPTPRPPGIPPVPTPPAPPAPPGVSPGAPGSPAATDASASAPTGASQALPSAGSGGSPRAGATPDGSGPPDIVDASDEGRPRGGLGQVTLVALGSATSVAGAAILVRQWRARRAARSAAGAGAPALGPVRRYSPRR